MKIDIGAHDPATRTVATKFTSGTVVHERSVNACYDATGSYDPAATEERVNQVAQGVAHKIAIGAITTPPAEAAPITAKPAPRKKR